MLKRAFLCAWLVFVASQPGFAACLNCSNAQKACGPNTLLMACRNLAVEADLDELKKLAGYSETAGTSLLGLQKAAKAKGLQAVAMKIGLADIASFRGQTIASLWGSSPHFVVVEPADAGCVLVTDPPAEPKVMPRSEFQKSYSGFALLIAHDAASFPTPRDEGPDLRMQSYVMDIGTMWEGDKKTIAFKYRNAGSADLVLANAEPSCSCITVIDNPGAIKPGTEAEIKLLFDSTGQRSHVAKTVSLSCNDPISPSVRLDLLAYVRRNEIALLPRTVEFGRVRRSESATSRVVVPILTGEPPVTLMSVTSDSPFVDARIVKSTLSEMPGLVVEATLKPGAPLGEFRTSLTLLSDHEKMPRARIPVAATVTGNVDLDHDCFFLGKVKQGEEAVAEVTLSNIAGTPLKLGKIEDTLMCIVVEAIPRAEGKEYTLTARLRPDAPPGNIKGDVVVHCSDGDQPEIRIPVFAYVER